MFGDCFSYERGRSFAAEGVGSAKGRIDKVGCPPFDKRAIELGRLRKRSRVEVETKFSMECPINTSRGQPEFLASFGVLALALGFLLGSIVPIFSRLWHI